MDYTLEQRSWAQVFSARLLDELDFDAELSRVGLRRTRMLSPRWLVVRSA